MPIDFLKDPPAAIETNPPRCDFWKPDPTDEEKLETEKAELAKAKAEVEALKAEDAKQLVEPEEDPETDDEPEVPKKKKKKASK